ncbi:MAG TPA: hypothetical protein VFV82_04940 [Candidatus Binatia bacterium]|nr:hypothetical protein [Candidatus Binatia bacterium]
MAAGASKGWINGARRKVITHAAKELTAAGVAFEKKSSTELSGEGFRVVPNVLRASNGEVAVLLHVSGGAEKKAEISKVLRLWY